eukprot:4059802-Pleurochrysis_carterae.AAC.1
MPSTAALPAPVSNAAGAHMPRLASRRASAHLKRVSPLVTPAGARAPCAAQGDDADRHRHLHDWCAPP